jgi:hypothetical protein
MKTAMQELIEYLEKNYYINELSNFDIDKIQFLEKEKEQIMNSYREGVNAGILYCNGEVFISKEEYYNQTYNQNK